MLEFLLALLIIIVLLPHKILLALGRFLGIAVCYIFKEYRVTAEKNLKIAFPDYSLKRIIKIRNDTFKNIAMNFMEFALINFKTKKFWLKKIEITGANILKKLLKEKKSIILVTAHIGNWELMASYLAMRGYPLSVVARNIPDKRLNKLLVNMRKRRKMNVIYRSGRVNIKKMLKVLKSSEILAVLIDQDTNVGGVFVDFFSRPAFTPTAVSQFARIKNTVAVPCFIYRKKDLSHKIIIKEPVELRGDEKKDTAKCTKIIENFIREHSDQWVWMHPRWKRQPEF